MTTTTFKLPAGAVDERPGRELAERLRWVIGLRWAVAAMLILVGVLGQTYANPSLGTLAVHVGLAALVLCYNFLYLYASKQPGFGESSLTALIRYGQVPVDLLVLTVLIHSTGGVTGPVVVLYFAYILVSLAILPPSGAYWVAALAAIFFALLAFTESRLGIVPPQGPFTDALGPRLSPVEPWAYVLTVSATLLMTAYVANYFARLLTRDESTIRRQLEEMNTLYRATQRMSTSLNVEEVMRNLVVASVEFEKPRSSYLVLFNDTGEGYYAASSGVTAEERAHNQLNPLSPTHPLVKQALAERKGVYAPDIETDPELKAALSRPWARSCYAVPMANDERLTGIVVLLFDRQYKMPMSHWNLLSTLAQHAALALERARLFTDAERAAREMTGLYHIGLATTSSLQIDDVLRSIYEHVDRAIHPDTFYIGLFDEDLGELTFDIFVENGEFLPPFRSRLEGGVSAWVVRNRKPVFVRNWSKEIEQLPFEAGMVGAPTQSVISVPLMAKNKLVGVMSVQSVTPDAFDHDHLRLLTSIAGQAALALENAKLHAQVFDQAQRDPLTGVYNHGTFIDKLHTLVRDAGNNGHSVTLIMLDIDRFKQYNDTFGHLAGDDVLRSIVLAIQDHLKSTDVVGRWGGEEFGIILPEVSRAQARLIADRIRQTAARTTLKDLHNRTIPSPTVSQGVALFPDDATSIEEMIDKADSALYRAKDLGRNQIAEWVDLEAERGPLTFRARG
ncbi:MAG: diguanylate cyclase [Chloroflexia bacterium]